MRARVAENIDRLPERQRLVVEGRWAHTDGEFEKSVELYEKLLSTYPDDGEAWTQMAHTYGVHLNLADKALDAYERGVKAVPQFGALRNSYGYELMERGRYPEAIRQFQTYAELSPDEPNPQDSLAEAYLITGQPEKAAERYARALELDSTFMASHGGRAWAFGMLGRYDEAEAEADKIRDYITREDISPTLLHLIRAFFYSRVGRLREAREHLRLGDDSAKENQQPNALFNNATLAAQIALEEDNPSAARKSIERARELLPEGGGTWRRERQVLTHLMAGVAAARDGDLDAARRELEAQKEIYDERDMVDKWWHHALEGEIAMAAGDLAAAESAFAAGEPELKMTFSLGNPQLSIFANNLPFRDGLARVRKAQGDVTGAIVIYRGLLAPDIGNKWTALLEPRYVLKLARLLDETGRKDAARAEYERFLELWKDADAGLPELKEAQAYLAP